MVIYVSPAEKNGGILQFSITMLKETVKSKEGKLFLPDSVEDKYYSDIADRVVIYQKTKTLNAFSKKVRDLAQMILHEKPDCVVFLEDSLLMQQLNYLLVKKSIKTAVFVHDVVHHLYRNMQIRAILVDMIRRIWMRKTVNQNTSILLLSNNSKKRFDLEYRKKRAKLLTMTLGAHVPNVIDQKPKELPPTDNYFLFFGRINKYKGIADLCQAYITLSNEIKEKHKLIIAGYGKLSEQEEALIEKDSNIYIINRFIEDEEMVWLYGNAKAVVLPYIEASFSLDIYGQVDENQTEWFGALQKTFPDYIRYGGLIPFDKSVETLKEYFALLFPTYYEGEGFAGTLIDAYSAGVPVIASDWKYNTELVNENVGYVYKTRDNAALAELLSAVATNPTLILKKKNACLYEVKKYQIENAVSILLNLIEA